MPTSTGKDRGASWRSRAVTRGLDPVLVVDLLQSGKAAGAGMVAWFVATDVLGLEQPFLAPWSAVLVVQATIYRTVSRGGQQVAATFAGVFLGWGCGGLLGLGPLGMGVMLVAAFALGRLRWLRDEATTIATTGIVVIATNAIAESNLLIGRLADTTVGIAVGLLVNLLVWPPLRDRAAWARAGRLPPEIAGVLEEMSAGMTPDLQAPEAESWIRDLRRIDEGIDETWRLLGQARESGRLNPRRSRPAGLDDLVATLHLLEQVVADTLSMARTLTTSAERATLWNDDFRAPFKQMLLETADSVATRDGDRLLGIREKLGGLAEGLSTDTLAGSAWYEYGGLLVNLRNVVDALAQVSEWSEGSGSAPVRSRRQVPRLRRPGAGYSEPDDDPRPRTPS